MARGCLVLAFAAAMLGLATPPALPQGGAGPVSPPVADYTPSPLQPGDAFGEEVILPERTVVFIERTGSWDKAFEAITDAFKVLNSDIDKAGIKPSGPAMTIYLRTDDKGFSFRAALPVAESPGNLPAGGVASGQAPTGKALKFTHRGSFDALNLTYEAIANHLDEKRLEARDVFIEEYTGNAIKKAEDQLVVTIFVPIK